MRAIDATRKQPVTVAVDATLTEVARIMDKAAVGALPILDGDRLVGMVTDRDLVVRGVARGLPGDSRVDAVMTTEPMTIAADADMREAFRIFSGHPIRRLPVVDDDGAVVGVLSVDDFVVDLTADLADLVRPVTGQVLFGHPEPALPAVS